MPRLSGRLPTSWTTLDGGADIGVLAVSCPRAGLRTLIGDGGVAGYLDGAWSSPDYYRSHEDPSTGIYANEVSGSYASRTACLLAGGSTTTTVRFGKS
jgi:hypothetical protein